MELLLFWSRSAKKGSLHQKYFELPRIGGSLTFMQRSCAHRWNPHRRSWTGPSQASTSGPSPHNTGEAQPSTMESYRRDHTMNCNEIAAKRRKKRKSSCIFAPFAPFGGYSRFQVWIDHPRQSSQIQANPGKSSQIVPMNIVFAIPIDLRPFSARFQLRKGWDCRICGDDDSPEEQNHNRHWWPASSLQS